MIIDQVIERPSRTRRCSSGIFLCSFISIFCIGRNTYLLHRFVKRLLKNPVGNQIRTGFDQLLGIGGFCHDRSTFSDLVHPLVKLCCLPYLWCADQIDGFRLALNHVRGIAASIGDGIMNSGFINHVFS